MSSSPMEHAIVRLCEEEPSYKELNDLHHLLRTSGSETPHENVTQYALAQVIGEFIDYLDLVADEFEKSIGLTREAERRRILATFNPPAEDEPLNQVADVIEQWRAVERYSQKDIIATVSQPQSGD